MFGGIKMFKIKSLFINNFKAFKRFMIEFDDSLTVIVGRKTNIF